MNYKALNLNFKETKFGWIGRIPGVRIMQGRWERFLRACNWFWFIYKQPCWQEYESLVAIIRKRLLDMADEFEKTNITTSARTDAQDMRLCADLLDKWYNEYYSRKYWDDGRIAQDKGINLSIEEFINWLNSDIWKEGYNDEDWRRSQDKDRECLHLACDLLKRMPGWWQ